MVGAAATPSRCGSTKPGHLNNTAIIIFSLTMKRPGSRSKSGSRPCSRTALDKASITYGATGSADDHEPPVHNQFFNRRIQDPYLTNVFPAGFSPDRSVKPPKYRHFAERFDEEGVREYIPVVCKPHAYQQRARSPASPKSPIRGNVGDEFRHVAGPFFKQLEIDDSVNFPGQASVVNLDSTSVYSSETMPTKSGSLPSLPAHARILRSSADARPRHYMKPKSAGLLLKGTPSSKTLAKLSPRAVSAVIPEDSTVIREVLSFQNQNLQLNLSLHRLEAALESNSASVEKSPPRNMTVPYEYQFYSLQKLVAGIVARDSRSKKMRGKFTIDMKFYKRTDDSWVPMNTELQWLHAKSCALDDPSNGIKILYGAVNQADEVRPPRGRSVSAEETLLVELKNRLNVNLHPSHEPTKIESGGLDASVSFHSIGSMGELSAVAASASGRFGGNTSVLFNDSVSSLRSTQPNNREKQKILAKNLEKRLVKGCHS